MKIGVVSGGFDPIHSGHIKYLNSAKQLNDYLVVLLNSDAWLTKKKGQNFLPFKERKIILANLESVDKVLSFKDDDLMSASNGLKKVKALFPNDEIMFCNGGDRTKINIPELQIENVKFKFKVGGSKKLNSSSNILAQWNSEKVHRSWGFYSVIQTSENIKLKELHIDAKSGLSFQKHFRRNELWFVREGSCNLIIAKTPNAKRESITLKPHDNFVIKKGYWHQAINPHSKPCRIYEIQYGERVIEEDIERLFYYNPS